MLQEIMRALVLLVFARDRALTDEEATELGNLGTIIARGCRAAALRDPKEREATAHGLKMPVPDR
jgi:hypothetical protein